MSCKYRVISLNLGMHSHVHAHTYTHTYTQSPWKVHRVGWFERIALKHVYYHMWSRSPAQVRFTKQDTQSWCTGTTLRGGMGRKVGGGFRMGDTCTPMADSYQCMAKTLPYCKVVSLQLKLINFFKKEGSNQDSVEHGGEVISLEVVW